MSKIAGLFLLLFGAIASFVGVQEVLHQVMLTKYAAYTTAGFGVLLFLAGLAHFRAPHKSFLISIPLLLGFQLQLYCIALFYDVKKMPQFLGAFLIASVLILYLSYSGYARTKQEMV